MKHRQLVLFAATILLSPLPSSAAATGHCAPARVTAVPGDPGAFLIETAHGSTVARRPIPPAVLTPPTATFRVYPWMIDFDGDTLKTIRDTIVVVQGSTVSWLQYQPDFHTITSGADSGDPNAGAEFNAILDGVGTTRFDFTFTTLGQHDFFCFIHEPIMEGTVIVIPATADVTPGILREAGFTRPPAPNPTRGGVSFAIALPRALRVQLSVLDIAGRVVATIEDAPLPAGERSYRWDGRANDGRPLRSGRYFVRLAAGDRAQTRAVSLIR